MFRINKLILLAISLIGSLIDPDILQKEISITTDVFGPFTRFQNNEDVCFRIKSKSAFVGKAILRCGYSYTSFLNASETSYRTFAKEDSITFTLPLRMMLGDEDICCLFSIIRQSDNQAWECKFKITAVTLNNSINPSEYKNDYFINPHAGTVIVYNSGSELIERYKFPNYLDYLNIDTYYRLDFSSVDFVYDYIKPFTYKNAYAIIYDYDNIFPYLTHKGYRISIPLTIHQNGKNCTFELQNLYYINPITGDISDSPIKGYKQTKYFYLPVNKKNYLLDQKIDVFINECGALKNNITWNLSYLASRNLIGDCSNSDYCVIEDIVYA